MDHWGWAISAQFFMGLKNLIKFVPKTERAGRARPLCWAFVLPLSLYVKPTLMHDCVNELNGTISLVKLNFLF